MFRKAKTLPIGLDISDYTLKLVQLKRQGDKLRLQAFGRLPMDKGVIENGEVKDQEKFIAAIKKLIAKPAFGSVVSDEVVTCLPETRTFIKLIEVEKSPNPLSNVIENEIQKHIPLAVKDIYFDWQVISESQAGYEVLIGAAPSQIVDQYASLLKSCGLFVRALEIESQAICRAVLPEESRRFTGLANTNYCVIDVGALRSNLVIYSRGAIVMSIHLPISGREVTEKIAKTLEIGTDQAEKAKVICGLDKAQAHGIIADILSDMMNDLVGKIQTAFDYYQSHFESRGPIDRILLTGGGANIKGLETRIADAVKTSCAVANVFIHLSEDRAILINRFSGQPIGSAPTGQDHSLSYATAIGLALRGANIDKE